MFCYPDYNPYVFGQFARPTHPQSYIRLLHASPGAPAVDIYANGKIIGRNLAYQGFTDYFAVAPGRYNIRVFPAGTMANPVLDTVLDVPPRSINTVAVIGQLPDIGVTVVPEPVMPIPKGKLKIRFAHLSPNAPRVDITLPDGTVLFRDVGYREVTDYIEVNPGTYTLQARPTGTDQVVLYVPNVTLKQDRFYTVYAVGLAGGNPPLQVLIPLDGNSYIKL